TSCVMINQTLSHLVRETPLPVRMQHPIDSDRRVSESHQIQQIREGEARARIVKITHPVPHPHEVIVESPWMLVSEHHELHHSPVLTPDAPPQARMKPSTSSPARSSTASADSGAYFARNSTSFAPLPD